MGMDPITLGAIIGAVGKTAESAFAPSPYQPRQSFSGTSADPVTGLTQVQNTLRQLLGGAIGKVSQGVDLPDAHVGTLPTFTGGGLPGPVGVTSAQDSGHGNLASGLHLPGLFGDGGQPSSSLPTSPMGGVVPIDNNKPTWTQPGDPAAPVLKAPPIAKAPIIGFHPAVPDTTTSPTLTGNNTSSGLRAALNGGNAGLGDGGGPLLPLDDKTQGALQLLFHTAALGQQQQQPQGAA